MPSSSVSAFIAGGLVVAVLGSGAAVAATGGNLILGRANSASATTSLTSSTGAPLALNGPTSAPPLTARSKVKAPNLNADRVDGLEGSSLARSNSRTGSYDASGILLDTDSNGLDDAIVAYVECPNGSQMTGGGVADYTSTGFPIESAPDTDGAEGWFVAVGISEEVAEDPDNLFATVVCLDLRGGSLPGSYRKTSSESAIPAETLVRVARARAARG